MNPKQRTQPIDPSAQQPVRAVDTPTRLRQLLGLTREEPALRMEQLAAVRGFPSGSAARQFVMRHRDVIAFRKVGRRVVVTLTDFDRGCERLEAGRRKWA